MTTCCARCPLFRQQPDQLSVLVREGRIECTAAPSLSYEYAYTLQLVALDFSADLSAIVVPLLAWLRLNQPELAANADLAAKSIRFEAQYLSTSNLDLTIEVDLTERIIVSRMPPVADQPDPDTTHERWLVKAVGEPPPVTVLPEHWQIIAPDGVTVLAEWDIPAERV